MNEFLRTRLLRIAAIGLMLIALVTLAGCASAPLDYPKETSVAIADTSDTRQAARADEWLDGRTDVSGFYPFSQGFDAFGARLRLMDLAEASIDAQYFLMKPDDAGFVFLAKLYQAADRGVRVRLLLDDIFTTMEDVDLAMLDNHPNVEVRIFNPVARKGIYLFNYLGHFSLANRRMHNKAFIVDNQFAMVGGRNIAVEYFQLETSGEFLDFDMLCAGPVVGEVSTEFDLYWNHELAVPMKALFDETGVQAIEQAKAGLQRKMDEVGRSIYSDSVSTPLMQQLLADELDPFIAPARLLYDNPEKLLEKVSDEQQIVMREVRATLAEAEQEIYIFTPYFIPRKRGIEFIADLTARGVRVVVITNSLATNNHTSVHSAYSSYRKDLLQAGVELWEARADAAQITTPEGETQFERLTLHTKGILIDRSRVFVGSLNLDPRSIDINTEMGLLIDSPALAANLTDKVVALIPSIAYQVKLNENNKLSWHATIDGREVVETSEPQTTAWRRFSAWFLKIAPERQL
jgi:putative cardiolipin synthase